MPTLEHLGWIALGLALIVAVGAVIMIPIYEKAKDQKDEIEDFDFDIFTSSNTKDKRYETAVLAVLDNQKYEMPKDVNLYSA